MKLWGLPLWLGIALALPVGCDDEEGEGGDDSNMEGAEEEGAEEGSADSCPDGENSVALGETRECECPDATMSTQQCLASGTFGACDCAGGW